MELELETVLSLLECPVCLLPPRDSPIYQCSTGHIVCSDCRPSLARCPICDIRYRAAPTRDFFAEKLLDHLERRCRYQHFGCEYSAKVSADLRRHETCCELKPALPVRRKVKPPGEQGVEGEGDNTDEEDDGEDEEEDEDDEEIDDIEDIFMSNFAFILVLLRAYILEYVDIPGKTSDTTSFSFEFLLLLLILAWLYHAWQENGFLMLDETSPFIASWFILVVVVLMVVRTYYNPDLGSSHLAEFQEVMRAVKPTITVVTGLVCCAVHAYVHNMLGEDNIFILSAVLLTTLFLAGLELFGQVQAQMDQFFYYLFWLQSFFIVLPFGLVGRNFLDF